MKRQNVQQSNFALKQTYLLYQKHLYISQKWGTNALLTKPSFSEKKAKHNIKNWDLPCLRKRIRQKRQVVLTGR